LNFLNRASEACFSTYRRRVRKSAEEKKRPNRYFLGRVRHLKMTTPIKNRLTT